MHDSRLDLLDYIHTIERYCDFRLATQSRRPSLVKSCWVFASGNTGNVMLGKMVPSVGTGTDDVKQKK